MVVVRGCHCYQLRPRSCRRHQRKHYPPCLGLYRGTYRRKHSCAFRELHLLLKVGRHPVIIHQASNLYSQSTLIFARYGNGIATNNLSKLLAGLLLPGLPIGNMYFAAWSHNAINCTVNLCNDLKMGEYRKCAPSKPLRSE
jgi:hypothetical protein